MKWFSLISLFTIILAGPTPAISEEVIDESEVLARRGEGVISQDQFAARADAIPADMRFGVLRDRNRLRDLLNGMLLKSQLAADARKAGFHQSEIVIERMQLAAQAELANAWLQNYVEMSPDVDFEGLAFESYQLNKDQMLSAESIDVSHILISTEERGEEEAHTLADSIYQQILQDASLFEQLVIEYSEDPSASANKGSFKKIKRGDMVGAFEEAAFALQPGQISTPVETQYGFHIIRLDAYNAPAAVSFNEVKEQLIERERKKHEQRIQDDYLSTLTALNVEMTEEALKEMVRRQFGEEVLMPEAEGTKTE